MNKKRFIISTLFLTAIIAALVYNYVFNAEHRNIANEEATVAINPYEFYSHFESNEPLATSNYLDKVVETRGEITLIEENDIVLDDRIQVRLYSKETLELRKGDSLTIKGRCVGYDELLEMVKIDQATIINN